MADDDASEAKKTRKNHHSVAWKQRRSVDVLINRNTCWGKAKEHLLDDVLSKIFLKFAAQYLHNVIRLVCKEWYLVIRSQSFTHHHARNSGCGLIIQDRSFPNDGIYVEIRQGSIEISKCAVGYLVWSSCNGLVLVPDFRDVGVLSVVNTLTKHRIALPPISGSYSEFVLAFVEASMKYKVVHKPSSWKMQLEVMTIGVDSVWRRIDIKNVPREAMEDLMPSSLVTGAYINWIGTSFVLTFSVETETFCRFPFPQSREERGTFLAMGNNLSVVYKSSPDVLKDVWEMDPKTGKWTMLHKFDYQLQIHSLERITPFGWLVAREVLVFGSCDIQTHCIAYNLKTREIQSFDLDKRGGDYHFQAHVNSLVRLE
ncbi:uncharacterized protein [Henckelia pumila]|uniref:uncharacterized protein n=1 Tax=Henckelia pumila TaxID=405737 RepID=UPI003C6E3359